MTQLGCHLTYLQAIPNTVPYKAAVMTVTGHLFVPFVACCPLRAHIYTQTRSNTTSMITRMSPAPPADIPIMAVVERKATGREGILGSKRVWSVFSVAMVTKDYFLWPGTYAHHPLWEREGWRKEGRGGRE